MNIPEVNVPRIVIIGGGFAGIELARSLKKAPCQIVLLDKHNYHTFQPLLYQVATAGLEPGSIGYPLRKVFKNQKNVFFRLTEVKRIDLEGKKVQTSIGKLAYDKLVIATGSNTNFFGNQQLQDNAMSMKSIPEALNIRSLILQNFEEALLTTDLTKREALMNVVVVGAGPTGVELAGAISELREHILPRDYPDLDVRRMTIRLIEAAPNVLSAMSEKSSKDALKSLEKLDVEVWLNTLVESYDGTTVKTNDGKSFDAKTLIWAAGVEGDAYPYQEVAEGLSFSNADIAIFGCTDANANNYDPEADYPDGWCEYDADFDNDGVINAEDLLAFLSALGCEDCPQFDLNGDGIVATEDLLAFLSAFGCEDCPQFDLNNDGVVATSDLLDFISFYGQIN